MSFLGKLFGRSGDGPAPSPARARAPLATDSGMWAVWDHARFAHVTDYESWEPELLEEPDRLRHVEAGSLVPIGIDSDGAFEFEVRVGSAEAPVALTEREQQYLTVSSEPYLFAPAGKAFISGIEHVHRDAAPPDALPLPLAPGSYAVTIHLIAWDEEPGARDASGGPAANALPDFVVLVAPAVPGARFRREAQTFPPPPPD